MLTNKSHRGDTAKLWEDCFVRPSLIIILWAVSQMVPYFFASVNVHYARYGMFYLSSMESLRAEV